MLITISRLKVYYTKIKDQNCDNVIIVYLFIKTCYYKSGIIRKHRVQLKKGKEKKWNEMPHVQNRLNFILLYKKRYVKKINVSTKMYLHPLSMKIGPWINLLFIKPDSIDVGHFDRSHYQNGRHPL